MVTTSKLMIELSPGYFQYVTHSAEGYGYSIYPTRAVDMWHYRTAKEQHPQFNFKIVVN